MPSQRVRFSSARFTSQPAAFNVARYTLEVASVPSRKFLGSLAEP
jgi:hypothetical protein